MTTKKIAILGCGNMAQAIVLGMYEHDSSLEFYTYTPSKTRAEILAIKVSGSAVNEISELPECDAYMIGCKPQQFGELALSLKEFIKKDAIILSLMAAIPTSVISNKLKADSILRIMPNTPSLVGSGVNAFYFSNSVSGNDKDYFTSLFKKFSKVYSFDQEDMIDTITPFSGSGPAYLFEFTRIFANKLNSMGLDEKTANEMIIHTFLGSAKLMAESSDSPEVLRDKVTSKKGVTYEALEVFKSQNLEVVFNEAIDKAFERTKTLS